MNKNNIILTGPPRSGTTLTCFLLNKLSNTIALHEPMSLQMFADKQTGLEKTDAFFAQMRDTALNKGTIISKVKDGKIPDNPFNSFWPFWRKRKSKVKKQEIAVDKLLNADFKLLIKQNAHFTFLLDQLVQDYLCYAIIRNPLSSIASWNSISAPVSKGNLTVLQTLDMEIYNILQSIPDLIDRQVQLMHYLFERYAVLPNDQIIRYEDIIASGGQVLSAIIPEARSLQEPLENKNRNKIYNPKLFHKIAERLLDSEGAYWGYYSKEEVNALID